MIELLTSLLLCQPITPVPPMPTQSQWETPAMKAAQSLADSTAAAPANLRTEGEISNWTRTGSYDEAIAFYRKLEKASPLARLTVIGKTPEGRDLYLFIVSKDKTFTPEAASRTGKPIILLQNGIHPGENGGKDASMMLLRDVLVTRKHAAWLDKVILLSIPVFNVDGHENSSPYHRINENGPASMGFRATSQRLNLNRDYLKADTPEMRAWLKMYSAWLPDFLVDNHVTDGSDHQYDVTFSVHTQGDLWPSSRAWVENKYLKQMISGMESDGHIVGWYLGFGSSPSGVVAMSYSPRYSTGYAAAQNRPGLLVETHSLKSFRVRAWAHYDIMRHTINLIAADPAALKQANKQSDGELASIKPGTKVFLEGTPSGAGEDYNFRQLAVTRHEGSAAGAPIARYQGQPADRATKLIREMKPKAEPAAPLGYLIPRQWTELVAVLQAHGVRLEPVNKPVTGVFETYRFDRVSFPPMPFEGRFQPNFTARLVTEQRSFPAGSWFVPMEQRSARVAMHLLEPDGPDSFVKWGFLNSIFEAKESFSDYIFEPIAEEMLKRDPALKAAFEEQLKKDEAFAKNPRARLAWLYERSPYLEKDRSRYPVVRVPTKSW